MFSSCNYIQCKERPQEILLDDGESQCVFPLVATVCTDTHDPEIWRRDARTLAAAGHMLVLLSESLTAWEAEQPFVQERNRELIAELRKFLHPENPAKYRVLLEVEVDAHSEHEAGSLAQTTVQNPDATATVFSVSPKYDLFQTARLNNVDL